MTEKTIGERIRAAREKAGKTIEQVAQALDMHPRTVLNWEHDLGSPRIDQARALCDAIDLSPAMLVFGRERRA